MRPLRIAWLWGSPRSIALLKGMKPLLEPQGVSVFLSHPSSIVKADSIVIPPAGDPERKLVELSLYNASLIVDEADEERALYKALSPPHGSFVLLRAGIDPGIADCGYAVFGDSLIIGVGRVPCDAIGERIGRVLEKAPARNKIVLVGDGPGLSDAAFSLESTGIDYTVVSEAGTTRNKPPYLPAIVRDKDAMAAVSIALRPAH